MSDVGRTLDQVQLGDARAVELLQRVYDELRRPADAKLAHEPARHTLDATALVHEAYLKLGGEQSFATQSAFMRAAAEAIRRVLVDRSGQARRFFAGHLEKKLA
jgi:hypothetical protein